MVHRSFARFAPSTHPDFRGRGWFKRLTLHGLEVLKQDGTACVFNLPNGNSRPGYLKMGWDTIGVQPTSIGPFAPKPLWRFYRAQGEYQPGYLPSQHGCPASELLADSLGVRKLLAQIPDSENAITTNYSEQYLYWRHGFKPLAYRAIAVNDDPSQGLAIFHLRRRAEATEATLCEALVPHGNPQTARKLVALIAKGPGVDFVRWTGPRPPGASLVKVPGLGPTLLAKPIAQSLPEATWNLTLGDIEVF